MSVRHFTKSSSAWKKLLLDLRDQARKMDTSVTELYWLLIPVEYDTVPETHRSFRALSHASKVSF